jgi:large-conductance mechanosensitive channel
VGDKFAAFIHSPPHTDCVELLTGFGLATAAGMNAYIPLLCLGLLSRFTDLITLPHGWAWLENGWVMAIVAVLLVVEIVADKIPALDSVNDTIQTFIRPTAGGIVFGSGTAAQTSAVADPGAFAQSGQWIPVAIGVVTALVVSLTKTAVRPVANVATAGMAAPVLSTIEDATSVGLVFLAILLPVLVLVVVVALVWAVVRLVRRRRRNAPA